MKEKNIKNGMTVRRLKAFLKTVPDNAMVYVSSDSEQNNYGTVSEHSVSYVEADNVCVLGMWVDFLQFEQIMPQTNALIEAELGSDL